MARNNLAIYVHDNSSYNLTFTAENKTHLHAVHLYMFVSGFNAKTKSTVSVCCYIQIKDKLSP